MRSDKLVNPNYDFNQILGAHWSSVPTLSVFGKAIRINEEEMNAATALTAVGPTYIFPVINALAAAAQFRHIDRNDVLIMAARTVVGVAELVHETGCKPEELKLMIGTRTLNEEQAEVLFTTAFKQAFRMACCICQGKCIYLAVRI